METESVNHFVVLTMNYYPMDYYYKCNLLFTFSIAYDPQNIFRSCWEPLWSYRFLSFPCNVLSHTDSRRRPTARLIEREPPTVISVTNTKSLQLGLLSNSWPPLTHGRSLSSSSYSSFFLLAGWPWQIRVRTHQSHWSGCPSECLT